MNHPNKKPSTILLLMTSIMLMSCSSSDATGNPTSLSSVSETTTPVSVSSLSPSDLQGRISFLEQKIATLEKDMSEAKPTLAKVDVMERQFRSLSLELDRIDNERLKPAKISKSKKSVKKDNAPKTSRNSGTSSVTGVRFGSNNGSSTRIVIDGGKHVSMTSDLDNNEKILVLEIKGLEWKTALNRTSISSPLVTSYTAQNTENGSRLVLQLKRTVKIGKVQTLSSEGSNGHRAFLDLTAQ